MLEIIGGIVVILFVLFILAPFAFFSAIVIWMKLRSKSIATEDSTESNVFAWIIIILGLLGIGLALGQL